jgi:hypothetical protein
LCRVRVGVCPVCQKMTFVAEETVDTLYSHAGGFRLLHEHT